MTDLENFAKSTRNPVALQEKCNQILKTFKSIFFGASLFSRRFTANIFIVFGLCDGFRGETDVLQ